MADSKISSLSELTTPASDDEFVVVDKSDTSMAGSGSDKRIKTGTFVPSVTSGTSDPSSTVADGSTYYKLDAAGQVVGVWVRIAGAWTAMLSPAPYVRLDRVATQGIGNNTAVNIQFDTEVEDTDGMADLGAANTGFTVVRPGIYDIKAFAQWAFNATGYRRALLQKTGFAVLAADSKGASPTIGTWHSMSVSERLGVGDQVWCSVAQNSGGTLTVTGRMSATWVRP